MMFVSMDVRGTHRISRIVAGEGHSLLLTVDGKVFTWGKGLFGRLGTGKPTDEPVPTEVYIGIRDAPAGRSSIVDIAAGSYHSLALADDGTVWSWGYNFLLERYHIVHFNAFEDGQLGYDSIDDSIPNPVSNWDGVGGAEGAKDEVEIHADDPTENLKMSKIAHVAAGGMMSCAISEDGRLWMWGNCPLQMDRSTEESFTLSICEVPRPVAGLLGLNVAKVACGYEHVIAMVNVQEVQQYACYSWGNNKHGQLGLGDREDRFDPEVIAALDEQNVGKLSDVSCGAYHTAVLTHGYGGVHKRKSMCWTFGMGDNGQLGQGRSQSSCSPEIVEGLPEGERLVAVSCGLFHMGVVTEAGEVWMWGMECGLGLCPGVGPPGGGGDYLSPVRVMGNFTTSFGKEMASGAAHTVVSANDGFAIFAWGRGQNGILGTGQSDDSLIPRPVIWPPIIETKAAAEVPAGSGDTTELSKGTPADGEGGAAQQEEVAALRQELAAAKEQASVLRAALYGPLESSNNTHATWALFQEWDKTIGAAAHDELVQLDHFYRQARTRVKEVLHERKVERLCKRFMGAGSLT